MRLLPLCFAACLLASTARAADTDEINAVQKRPLRQAKRLELWAYGTMSIADPYQQRWGGGLRGMYHLREGLSVGLDVGGLATWATQDLVIAKRELHARIIESSQRASVAGMASIAPIYGKVALPGDALVHFETFLDAGLGGVLTETEAGRGEPLEFFSRKVDVVKVDGSMPREKAAVTVAFRATPIVLFAGDVEVIDSGGNVPLGLVSTSTK